MTDQPPGYTPPKPVRDRSTPIGPIAWLLLTVAILAVAAAAIGYSTRQHTGAASPVQPVTEHNRFHMEVEESQGGITTTKGTTDGPSMHLSGNNMSASDLQLTVPIMSFDFGSVGGGSFAGSFKVSAGTALLLQWLCALLAIPCAVSGAFKWVGKDYPHAIGQWLCAIGLILAAMIPVLLGWFGFGAIIVLLVSHWFPSAAAKFGAILAQRERAIDVLPAELQKTIRASTTEKQDAIASKVKAA